MTATAHDRELLAVGIDLGSTRIKAARLNRNGELSGLQALASPPLTGDGPTREGDAAAYVDVAERLLSSVAQGLPRDTPLGLASQRSTFVLWDRETGRPLRPMVSWQDTRGAGWCRRNTALQPEVLARTGLMLSGHYAGPKLAAMQENEDGWRERLRDGRTLFGTLESYAVWRWTAGRQHVTDPSIAARTLLLDLHSRDWSPWLLDRFDVPRSILAQLAPTSGRGMPLDLGLTLSASIGDQGAGAVASFTEDQDCALVNLGTGAFVLCPAPSWQHPLPGYLTGPVLAPSQGEWRFAREGTINGAGTAVDRFGRGPTALPDADPTPEAFCIPDTAGLGSPYWRPSIRFTLSDAARSLDDSDKRRVALEGLLFRIRQVLDDLQNDKRPRRIFLSGGLAQEPFVPAGLATLLGHPVEQLQMQESALIGTARLAAGLQPHANAATQPTEPSGSGAYLVPKYRRWTDWLDSLL